MAAEPSPTPPTPIAAPRPSLLRAGRVLWGVLAGIGLLLVVGIGAVWLATRPAPTPPTTAPLVQSLVYQDLNGAVLSVDATNGVTRTLLAPGAFVTNLLDVSPDSLSLAYVETTRPITATTWYTPVQETMRVRGRGGAVRTVRLPTLGQIPDGATFIDDDTLALLTRRGRNDLRQLYLYSLETGTTRLLADKVSAFFPLREQAMVLYTHELTGAGVFNPGGTPRIVELAALEVGGALTPQPLAAWSLRTAGAAAAAVWPDPARNTVFYTRLDTPATLDQAWGNPWYPLALMALPVRPLGTPQPVATFTSEFVEGGVEGSQTGRYLIWSKARPTAGLSTPTGIRQITPIPQGLGEIRWADGKPRLVEVPVPNPSLQLGFVAGGDLVTYLDNPVRFRDFGLVTVVGSGFTPVPDRATIAAANRTPTPTPLPPGRSMLYDPATGQSTPLRLDFNTGWDNAGRFGQSGLALARDDRLLVLGPDPASSTPLPGAPPAPTHLLLLQRAGNGWRTTSLGAVGTATLTAPIILKFYGLTPDRSAVILSRPSAERTFSTVTGPGRVTLLYRVPLAGGDWTLLGQALPDHPVLPHKPNE